MNVDVRATCSDVLWGHGGLAAGYMVVRIGEPKMQSSLFTGR